MTDLEAMLRAKADEIAPLDSEWPDHRGYREDVNPDAIEGDQWLENRTSYIWKVGVLGQWDSNKFDHAHLFIGHERRPGDLQFIGHLYWREGENDDIGRCLARACNAAAMIAPALADD